MSAPADRLVLVVGSDGSPDSERAIDWAAAVAASHSGAALHLFEALALPPTPLHAWSTTPEALIGEAERRSRARLEARSATIAARGVETAVHVQRFFPVEAIVTFAAELPADLIVLGRHGHSSGLRRALIGSVSADVSRSATVPVVVVRGTAAHPAPPRRVLVPFDGSEPARVAARAAARLFPAAAVLAVSVVHGREGLEAEAIAHEAVAAGFDRARLEIERVVGDPAAQILRLAGGAEVDLVAAGRRGHGPLHELLVGGVAEKLLQLAPCPILLAH